MIAELVLSRAVVVALVAARIGGFVVASPFPGQQVTQKNRAALVLAIALPVATWVKAPEGLSTVDLELLPVVVTELLLGICIGMTFRFVLYAATFLGDFVSISSGLSVPSAFSPDQPEQQTPLTRILTLAALFVAIAAGVHRVAIGYLLSSFEAVPIQSPVTLAAASPIFIELMTRSVEVGVQLAIPVAAVSLSVQAALGLLARAAPTLQLFSIGFTVMVGVGVSTLMVAMSDVFGGLLDYMGSVDGVIERVFWEITR